MIRWMAITLVVAVGATSGALAATGGGGDAATHPAVSAGGWHSIQVSEARTGATAASSGIQLAYVTGSGTVAARHYLGGALTCPRSHPHAIGGFFDSNSDTLALAASRPHPINVKPMKARSWYIGVADFGSSSARVGVGVLCAK